MTPAILNAVKRPLLVGIASGLCSTAVVMLWLRFPSFVPLGVLMAIGFVGGVTFLVCETMVVLRVAKMFMPPGPLVGEVRNLPRRTFVALAIALVLCNGVVICFTDLQPKWVYVLVLSAIIIFSWLLARLTATRYMERRDGRERR